MRITITNRLLLTEVPHQLRPVITRKLTFQNPRWSENERMGRWNYDTPKTLCFCDRTDDDSLAIPRGYIRQLIYLCRHYGIHYELDDRRRLCPSIDFKFQGRLKPFQNEAVQAMLSKDFGTLSAPTGSGKTVMALYMIAQRKQPALIVVHTKDLASQWIDRVETFLQIPKKDVGVIGGGKRTVGEKLTVALIQSLYKCANEVSQHVGYIIVDECHRTPSRTFTEAVDCFDSRYMLGLSATPFRRDNLSRLIFWFLGDLHHRVDKTNLIQSGEVLAADVIFRNTDFKPYYDPTTEYSKMLSELTTDDDRNRLIASDVAQETENTAGACLVLSDRKKHCEMLQAILQYKHKISSEVLTGDVSSSRRGKVLERLNQGQVKVLIATGQLIGEGFDCRNLATLFLATPIRFSGRVLQYLGRVLRPAPGKKKARVYDYVDVKVDALRAAARVRQAVYRNG